MGGVVADLQGGNFGHGFIAAGFTASLKGSINKIGGGAESYKALRVVTAATIGGTASVLSGGKFANGAFASAFTQLFNGEAALKKKQKIQQIEDAYDKLVDDIYAQADANPSAIINLSKEQVAVITDQLAVWAEEQPVARFLSDKYISRMAGFDTFLYDNDLVGRMFNVSGIGLFKGGEINYLGVGVLSAYQNDSLLMLNAQIVAHNGLQILQGQGWHNYSQSFSGSFWAGYGREAYNEFNN